MRDRGIDKGLVREFDTSARPKGIFKGIFGFRKMFWDYLNKLHVPFSDECCDEAGDPDNTSVAPVRSLGGALQEFNGTTWVTMSPSVSQVTIPDSAVSTLGIRFGADANNGFYGVSDTVLGVAVEGAQVANFDTAGLNTDVIGEKTAATGVTVDSVLLKDGGVSNSGATMFAGFFPTTAAQALSGAGAVNVTAYLTKYTSTGGAQALSIASGTQIGQRKKIVHVVDGGSGVLTGVFVGGTTITFTTVAEFADLIWTGSAWGVLELGNSAVPGTPPTLA